MNSDLFFTISFYYTLGFRVSCYGAVRPSVSCAGSNSQNPLYFKFGTVGALNISIYIRPGFRDYLKFHISYWGCVSIWTKHRTLYISLNMHIMTQFFTGGRGACVAVSDCSCLHGVNDAQVSLPFSVPGQSSM